VAQREGHRGEDREERANQDQRDLRVLVDADPEDQQGNPGQRRDGAHGADRGTEEGVRRAGEPQHRTSGQAERGSGGEAQQDALGADAQVDAEFAALEKFGPRRPRRRPVGAAGRRKRFPSPSSAARPEQQRRDDQPQQGIPHPPGAAGAAILDRAVPSPPD
jgi:hypothetical protein